MDKSTNNTQLDLALADLAKQAKPNFSGTATKYQVHRTTLQRRFLGTQQSRRIASSDNHQCLSLAQEETLIDFINDLTNRSIPPTSQIVRNVAEELAKGPIQPNWVGRFTRRYKDRLHTKYLQTIDAKRVKADYIPNLERFYKLVHIVFILLLV